MKWICASRLKVWQRIALVLLLCPALIYLAKLSTGEPHLRKVKQTLEAEGILLPLHQVLPPPSKEEARNAEGLLLAIRPLNDLDESYKLIGDGQVLMEIEEPGLGISGVRGDAPLQFSYISRKMAPKSWEDLRISGSAVAPILAEAVECLKKPIALDHEHLRNVGNGDQQRLQRLNGWLKASAVLKLRDGDASGAVDDLTAIFGLGALRERSGYFYEYASWSSLIVEPVWEVLQISTVNDADLGRLGKLVGDLNFIERCVFAMKVELAQLPQNPRYYADAPWDLGMAQSIYDSSPVAAFRNALWRVFREKRELAFSLNEAAISVRAGNDLLQHRNWQLHPPQPIATRDPGRLLTLNEAVRLCSMSPIVTYETTRQLALAAIALERYRLRHGDYPATLDPLVPDFLPELPHDWFDGHPLKYQRLAADRFLLYSIGEDEVDDGGDPTARGPKGKPNIHSGRDLVWPQAKK